MPEEKPNNNINPGKSFGRRAISGCKCLCLVITGLIVAGIGLFLAVLLAGMAKNLLAPHSAVFHGTALSAVADRGTVVQPLVDRSDKFDILVTVWLRNEDSPQHDGPKRLKKIRPMPMPGQPEEEVVDELLPVEADSSVVETPLYSDVVFRGMKLTDKNVFRDVNFTVPTAHFRGANLANYDLRASVVLIPHAPSLLDQTTNYSTWFPDSIKTFPVRPYDSGHAVTLADHVIDTFSDTFPLVEFHGIPSRCPKVENKKETNNPFLDDGETSEPQVKEEDLGPKKVAGSTLHTTEGRNPIYSHPYIVTRTNIRVIDETGIFSRKAYIKEHKHLKENSCGQRTHVYPGRYFCQKHWPTNGHWETQLQLSMMNDTTGEHQTEWAYGPYVFATRYGFGQQDLLPVPVNRATCEGGATAEVTEEPETLDVIWHLSFSGRTAAKMALADIAGTSKYYAFNGTELERFKAHDHASIAHGMWGVPFTQNDYARTRMGIWLFVLAGGFVESALNIRYWFTRKSTEGISIGGTSLIATSAIIPALHDAYTKNKNQGFSIPGWIAILLFTIVTEMPVAVLMLKAINRVYFHWWTETSWFPAAGRAEATRNEKASERLESELGWVVKGGLLLALFAVNWYFDIPNYVLVKASFPLPEGEIDGESIFMPTLFHTMVLVGQIQQLILNAKTKKFAGAYAITTYLTFAMTTATIVEEWTGLLGKTAQTKNMTAQVAMIFIVEGIAALQAWTLPPVEQDAEGLHED